MKTHCIHVSSSLSSWRASVVLVNVFNLGVPPTQVRIDDVWYDLSLWRAAHPGGTHWIDLYKDQVLFRHGIDCRAMQSALSPTSFLETRNGTFRTSGNTSFSGLCRRAPLSSEYGTYKIFKA